MFIVEKMGTLLDGMIHIMFECVVHHHGDWNKMVFFMKPSILADFCNGVKFCNYTCCSTNDTQNHHLSCQVNNHHIGNENLVLLGRIEIDS